MKKRIITRIFSILLCLVMLSSLFPTAVFADWEDGMECWFCGHYHWDEYCCGMCGACSEECTNGDCYLSTHCSECGAHRQTTMATMQGHALSAQQQAAGNS